FSGPCGSARDLERSSQVQYRNRFEEDRVREYSRTGWMLEFGCECARCSRVAQRGGLPGQCKVGSEAESERIDEIIREQRPGRGEIEWARQPILLQRTS